MPVKSGPASCSVCRYSNGRAMFLASLYCPAEWRRQGHATRVLPLAKEVAHTNGLPLFLTAAPFADAEMSVKETEAFYERNDFEVVSRYVLGRHRSSILVYLPGS